MKMYLPIALLVLSNVFYHICSKLLPNNINPFAALTLTYIIAAIFSLILYLVFSSGGNVFLELKKVNWAPFVLGICIVGLEAGAIYMYKAGWNISIGQLVSSSVLTVCLIIVGVIFFKEKINITKIAGIAICSVGLFLINK